MSYGERLAKRGGVRQSKHKQRLSGRLPGGKQGPADPGR